MSKLVCHMGKYTRSNVFGLQKHNQRENKNYSNENVDSEKSHLNYDLANENNIKYLQRVDKIIDDNRTNTNRAVRKDAVVFVDTVVSSDKEFFKDLSDQDTRRFFEESYKYLQEKVGKENIVAATVHMDENTPHMHLSFVPMNEDGSLSAKKKINRTFLREVQDEFPKYLKNKDFDIERGMEKSMKKHLEPLEYKKVKVKEEIETTHAKLEKDIQDVRELEQKVHNASESLSKTNSHINSVIRRLDKIEAKKSLFSDKLMISQEDYSVIMQLAKQGESKLLENYQLKSNIGDLKSKLNSEKFDNEMLRTRLEAKEGIEYENSKLKYENKELKKRFERVESAAQKLNLVDMLNSEIKKSKEQEVRKQVKTQNYDIEL